MEITAMNLDDIYCPDNLPAFRAMCAAQPDNVKKIMAEHMSNDDPRTIPSITDKVFEYACEFNQLELAKWIEEHYFLGDLLEYEDVIDNACAENHVELFKWLYIKFPQYADKYYLLQSACEDGHIEICEFIAESCSFNHRRLAGIFYKICKNSSLRMIKWFSTERFNKLQPSGILQKDVHFTIFCMCANPDIEVLKWFIKAVGVPGLTKGLSRQCRRYMVKIAMKNGVKFTWQLIRLTGMVLSDIPREYRVLFAPPPAYMVPIYTYYA